MNFSKSGWIVSKEETINNYFNKKSQDSKAHSTKRNNKGTHAKNFDYIDSLLYALSDSPRDELHY